MISEIYKKEKIEAIREEILKDRNSRLWKDFTNSLKLITQVVFTKSSGFILEFLQNAEDAGGTQGHFGIFKISFGTHSIRITHNGRPFDEKDVESICGIRSTKKPETGTLGYLGIGFKSVFKVTDAPEIYSNGYSFKFDKNFQDWGEIEDFPWGITPIWIENPPKDLEEEMTTFIIPIKSTADLSLVKSEVKNLSPEVFLYLKWIKKIIISDEETKSERVLGNLGESGGVFRFEDDKKENSYFVLRKEVEVPPEVGNDPLTLEFRRNVKKREISIAFYVDSKGNLCEAPAASYMGGLYSFVPIGEVSSGSKFLIQADFLVQPGRDALNYEAKWNQWLISEIANLSWEAVTYFKNHEKWKYQFFGIFQFQHNGGTEAYEKLFKPFLIESLEKKLAEDRCIITRDNEWEIPANIYTTDESTKALDALSILGLCERGKEAEFLTGKIGAKLLNPSSLEWLDCELYKMVNGRHPTSDIARYQSLETLSKGLFKRTNRLDLLSDDERLKLLWSSPAKYTLFESLYTWLKEYPLFEYNFYYSWNSKHVQYHRYGFIPDRSGQLKKGGDLYYTGPELIKLDENTLHSIETKYPLIDQNIFKSLDEEKITQLLNYLRGYSGLQTIDLKRVYLELILPKVKVDMNPPQSKDELLNITVSASEILQDELSKVPRLWVLCKDGEFRHSDEVIFSKDYNIQSGWESNSKYLPTLHFLSPSYLEKTGNGSSRERLIAFLKASGVRESPEGGVEEFAMNYVINYLEMNKSRFGILNVQDDHLRNYGYDLDITKKRDSPVKVEVKGLSSDSDITLTENETQSADRNQNNYYVIVVSNIPSAPEIHSLKNPSYKGKKKTIILPIELWRAQPENLY